MKHLKFFLVFLVTMMMGAISSAWAAVGNVFTANTTEGVAVTYIVLSENGTTGTVQAGVGYNQRAVPESTTGTVTIPETVNYGGIAYSVTVLGDYSFYRCTHLNYVGIPNTVTKIGRAAFGNCFMRSLDIPASLTEIGNRAFYSCPYLDAITVDPNNTVFDSRNDCNAVIETNTNKLLVGSNNTVIPDDVVIIGEAAFQSRSGLKSATLPEGLTTLEEGAFYYCTGLPSINIPSTVTSIGQSAFGNCTGITSITIPSGVASIGSYAFSNCSNLKTVTCNRTSPLSLGTQCFADISNYNKLFVPEGSVSAYQNSDWSNYFTRILEIGDTSIGLGDEFTIDNVSNGVGITFEITDMDTPAVTVCGYSYDSTNPVTLNLPETATYSGITFSLTDIASNCFENFENLTSVSIPSTVTHIGPSAFQGCTNLSSIDVPNSVTSIGYGAFDETEWFDNQPDGIVYTGLVAYQYKGDNIPSSITIAEGTKGIADWAFCEYTGLSSITLPSSIIYVGEGSFGYCGNLATVTCNAQNPPELAEYAFSDIANNPTLYVPEGCVNNYQITFWSIYFNKIRVIGDTSFGVGDSFTAANADGVNITYMITSSSTVMTYGYWDDNNDCAVTAVPSNFSGSLTIPSKVTCNENAVEYTVNEIGGYSFCMVSGLTEVEIPESVESIGEAAFAGSYYLNSVTVNSPAPASLGDWAFDDIGSDATLYVPEGSASAYQDSEWSYYFNKIRVIGSMDAGDTFTVANAQGIPITYSVIDENSVITFSSTPSDVKGALYIPETVTYSSRTYTVKGIGTSSFINCTDLTSVTIPSTVIEIGSNAFKGCTSLSLTTILSPVISIGEYAFYDNIGYFTFFAEEAPSLRYLIYGLWYKEIQCYVPEGSVEDYKSKAQEANWQNDNADRIFAIGDVGFFFPVLDEENVNIRYEVTSTSPAEVKVHYYDYIEYFGQGKQDISIPETVTFDNITYSVTGIAGLVGGNCVTSLFVPKSVTTIDDWAFGDCNVLESIVVDEDNTVFDSHDGSNAIIQTNDHILVAGCKNTVIPDDVTAIGMNAFGSCDGLSLITIPSSVISIGESAFAYCHNLVDVICYAETPPTLDDEAFAELSSNAKLYVPEEYIDNYKSDAAWTSYFDVANILPVTQYKPFVAEVGETFSRFTEDGEEVTYQITSLDEVNHTGTVRLYGWYDGMYEDDGVIRYKYRNCINKSKIYDTLTIPSTVTFGSGDDTFTYTVTEVGDYAFLFLEYSTCILPTGGNPIFSDCKYIYLPSTITRIGKYAFSAMGGSSSDVIYAYLPEGVEEIDDFAFQKAYFLKQLSLPKSLKRIGRSAFEECEEIEKVWVYNPIPIQPTVWHEYEIDPQPRYAFDYKFRSRRTLYVPYGSKYKYLSSDYWGFGKAANGGYLEGCFFQYVEMMNNKEDDVTTIEPEDEYSTDFAMEMVDGDDVLDLQDAVAGGVYYNLKSDYENGFAANEGCIVINNNSDMSGVSGDFDRAFLVEKDYSGMVVEVQGKGIVMIDCQTLGSGKLTVRIGDGIPVAYEQNDQGAICIHFEVSSPTPIYIYASGIGGQSANAYRNAPRRAGSVSDNCVKIYSLNIVPNVEFSISSVGMGTFACNSALDFTDLEDVVKVYYATYDDESSELTFHQIRKVPPHTGVLLVSVDGDAVSNQQVPVILDRQYESAGENVFVQGTGETVSYSEEDNLYDYILYNGDSGLGFYKANKNPVATNRAYIHIPYYNDMPVAPSANFFAIHLDEADGIATITNGQLETSNDQIYNLSGQRLSKLQRGVNIVNGKKVLVK